MYAIIPTQYLFETSPYSDSTEESSTPKSFTLSEDGSVGESSSSVHSNDSEKKIAFMSIWLLEQQGRLNIPRETNVPFPKKDEEDISSPLERRVSSQINDYSWKKVYVFCSLFFLGGIGISYLFALSLGE